jgi:hypothetical protein
MVIGALAVPLTVGTQLEPAPVGSWYVPPRTRTVSPGRSASAPVRLRSDLNAVAAVRPLEVSDPVGLMYRVLSAGGGGGVGTGVGTGVGVGTEVAATTWTNAGLKAGLWVAR